jgi:hypothetical protein
MLSTKDEFKKNIIKFFKKESGLSITEAKAKIRSTIIIDKYGNTDNDRIKAGNVTLFFTNNKNYGGGEKNGYGRGWYISNIGFTGGSEVKLSNKL